MYKQILFSLPEKSDIFDKELARFIKTFIKIKFQQSSNKTLVGKNFIKIALK